LRMQWSFRFLEKCVVSIRTAGTPDRQINELQDGRAQGTVIG
jgi:hypothetical protein